MKIFGRGSKVQINGKTYVGNNINKLINNIKTIDNSKK